MSSHPDSGGDENDRSNILGTLPAAVFVSCRNIPALFTATVPIHVSVIYRLLSTGHVLAALRCEPSSQWGGGQEGCQRLIYERFNALFPAALRWLPLIYLHETSLAYKAQQKGEAGVCGAQYEHHGTEAPHIRP